MTDTIEGAAVLDRGRSNDPRFPWVVLCQVPRKGLRWVVWYEDDEGARSIGYYTTSIDDARAEFERRTARR